MSATNAIAYNELVIWPTRDQEGYYAEITNRQGEDIHTIMDSYETDAQAVRAAREWIDLNETMSRLTPVAVETLGDSTS